MASICLGLNVLKLHPDFKHSNGVAHNEKPVKWTRMQYPKLEINANLIYQSVEQQIWVYFFHDALHASY